MLDFNASRADRDDGAVARTTRHRFVFAGVAFEILAGDGVEWELPRAFRRFLSEVPGASVIAELIEWPTTTARSMPTASMNAATSAAKSPIA